MLHESTKTGTAKRLSDMPFYIASKTGTSSISKKNIDAYNISYTTNDVVGCWIGNIDNSPIKIVGGGTPTAFVKNYLNAIYSNIKPKDFTIPSSVVELDIDLIALKNDHILYKANNYLPDRFKEKAYFSRFNEPKNNFNNNLILTPVTIEAKVNGNIADIFFNSNAYYSYMLYKIEDGKEIFIDEISNTLEKIHFKQELTSGKIHSFAVKTKAKNYITGEEIISELSNIVDLYIK